MFRNRRIEMPDQEEGEAIDRGIAADPDTIEITPELMERMKPFKARGRPRVEHPKVQLSMRYDADIIDAFRASGDGWQTRINAALRDWLKTHSPA